MQNIKKGEFHFKKPIWEKVSPEAKILITDMLNKNPMKRPEMSQVM